MPIADYQPPVAKLLTYGECKPTRIEDWPNYVQELALQKNHIPALLKMVADESLNSEQAKGLEIWAPIHAWRALGQLEALATAEPLLEQLEDRFNDWAHEEIPIALSLMGPSVMPAVQQYLAAPSHDVCGRISAIDYFRKLESRHPQEHNRCIEVITNQLAKHQENEPAFNGFLIAGLCDLHAVEKASDIEQAFAANHVDLSIMGDWDEAQVALGLKTRQEVPHKRFSLTEAADVLSEMLDSASFKVIQQRPSPQGFSNSSPSQKRKKTKKKCR